VVFFVRGEVRHKFAVAEKEVEASIWDVVEECSWELGNDEKATSTAVD